MADDVKNKTISSTDSGFPSYLDFDKLRSEAIAYLGNLSGKIWTDHNAHDPGITILEALIYAVLDLGYRTNLPAVDVFTKNPADESQDNNFFTPAKILANNPFTITDYRKLLIDVAGVKNAWLEIEENVSADFCRQRGNIVGVVTNPGQNEFDCFLNGLYHVFVELEKDVDLNNVNERAQYDAIITDIKCALMSHRNLCEDFIDIKVLCRLPIGLCADIELEADSDGAAVYLKIIETLRDFFSPAPKFYTLPQLLDKGKSIEDIFSGRPYNIKESHGFVDIDELEVITLRKKIHLSDVYHVLFDIGGVKNVRNLAWKLCHNDGPYPDVDKWEIHLPENFIPEFDSTCSGFQFFKYGTRVQPDLSKANSLFAMNFSTNGKILYTQPLPNLDVEIPQGVYHPDMADYYSIQNEFPHVYGIGKGDLAGNTSNERKAQALQLQGFLLFFDQLLANYLIQLKNVRSLFALSSSDESDQHTYFTNELTNVPQIEKLLRFNTGVGGNGNLGNDGSILAYPTDRLHLENLIASGKIKNTDLDRRCNDVNKDDFPEYKFCFGAVRDQAQSQLINDLLNGDFDPVIISNYNDCWFFYCFTSSTEFALISKKYYASETEAQTAAASIKYLGTFAENYRSFLIDDNTSGIEYFSFDLELNVSSYAKYLQLIAEDTALYNSRRQDFLDHLLSRFAEQFTEYAMLTSGFLNADQLRISQIKAEEKFLSKYDDLSSNRGRAYDYLCDGWENENISGFEKRVKALCGIEEWRKHYLCNFLVEQADEIYYLAISLFGHEFKVENKLVTYEAGMSSLKSVYNKISAQPQLNVEYIEQEQKWTTSVKDDFGNTYLDTQLFNTKEAADTYSKSLQSTLVARPAAAENIYVSKYIFRVLFKDYANEEVAETKEKFESKEEARKYFRKIVPGVTNNLNDSKQFSKIKKGIKLEKLAPVDPKAEYVIYIDKEKFGFRPVDVIQLDTVKKKFALLNDKRTLQFDSLIDFDSVKLAENGFTDLLLLLTSLKNYKVSNGNAAGQFSIFIIKDSVNVAVYFKSFSNKQDTDKKVKDIFDEILSHTYQLSISDPIPDNWEFKYQLTDPAGRDFDFATRSEFTSEGNAKDAAQKFYDSLYSLKISKIGNEIKLAPGNARKSIAYATITSDQSTKAASQLLQYHQDFLSVIKQPSKEMLDANLNTNINNEAVQYVYKLVDKNNLLSKYPTTFGTKADALVAKNDLLNSFANGYFYTGISFGTDIIIEKKDAGTNKIWYHYQVKCTNVYYQKGTLKNNPLVLFISVQGYASAGDAMNAFLENYLIILRKAHLNANFGINKFVSLTEILIHLKDDCTHAGSIVFIPSATIYEYDGIIANVVKQMIDLAKSYPVLFISGGRYKFTLYNHITQDYDWRSMKWYTTPREAMTQFLFFMDLLKYAGNYYIEKDNIDCRYRIYIREVLAVSATTFQSPSEAWGEGGVEKFICITQTENGFHNYLKQDSCRYSFFVACSNMGLVHPCKYETPKRRDTVLRKLYQAASFNFFDLLQNENSDGIVLLNLDKKPIARLLIQNDPANNFNACERLVEIFDAIYIDDDYLEKEKAFYLADSNKNRIAIPLDQGLTWMDWKQMLTSVACYFPLIKKVTGTSNAIRNREHCNFYVQIKLPGFDTCEDDATTDCMDRTNDIDCTPGCYIAWRSDCCFATCCDALQFYIIALRQLSIFSNYKAVYDCDCSNYGIELYYSNTIIIDRSNDVPAGNSATMLRQLCGNFKQDNNPDGTPGEYKNECVGEIVAINPQQYSNSTIACEAVTRSGKLINSEGMHLVEHILLRPRCKNSDGVYDDCNCTYLPQPCVNDFNTNKRVSICHFQWMPGEEDPCLENAVTYFTPGCDPYSFIATVAMPAWPQRFRTAENRAVIEKLLQREAPAHVLLRIIWLNPRDFCCFEFYFKKWNLHLAKKLCDPQYDNCDFLGLLFHKNYQPLSDCNECKPCTCNEELPVSCFDDESEPCADFNLLTQINNLYCWNRNDYDTYNCEAEEIIQAPVPILAAKVKPAKPLEKIVPVTEAVAKSISGDNSRKKYLVLQGRANAYKEMTQQVVKSAKGNKVAENALRFLADAHPDPDRYDDIVHKILKNKTDKTKNSKGLTIKEKRILINNVSWQYFDRVCIDEKKSDPITTHHALFNHLRKNKIDMHALYDDWNGAEIKKLEPAIDLNEIKKVVT